MLGFCLSVPWAVIQSNSVILVLLALDTYGDLMLDNDGLLILE